MRKDEIRDRIFASKPPETREVEAFGAKVVLHRLTWGEIQEARSASIVGEGFDSTRHTVALLTLAARDEAGERIFVGADIHELLASDGGEIDRLVMANLELQGLTQKQAEQGKES